MTGNWRVVHDRLTECCQAVFEGLGQELIVADEAARQSARSDERLASFIGFSGNEMRGAILMDLPSALVARLHPAASASRELDNDERCDWGGELANQVLGRLKNGLLCFSVSLQLSTPSCVFGRLSHGTKLPSPGSIALHFSAGAQLLLVHFDAELLKPIDFDHPSNHANSEPQAEGDMLLF